MGCFVTSASRWMTTISRGAFVQLSNLANRLDRSMSLLCCRQGEPEYGAPRLIVVYPQPTPMRDDDGTADRQPHPDSAGLCRVEWFENPLEMFPINARSRIAHFDKNATGLDLLGSDR